MRTAKTLIRLGGCPDWSESSLGAHAILLVLSWGGSYNGMTIQVPNCIPIVISDFSFYNPMTITLMKYSYLSFIALFHLYSAVRKTRQSAALPELWSLWHQNPQRCPVIGHLYPVLATTLGFPSNLLLGLLPSNLLRFEEAENKLFCRFIVGDKYEKTTG